MDQTKGNTFIHCRNTLCDEYVVLVKPGWHFAGGLGIVFYAYFKDSGDTLRYHHPSCNSRLPAAFFLGDTDEGPL